MIIGLTGYARSGKDTVANYLVEHHGYTRVAFADAIRKILYDMDPMIGHVANEAKFLRDYVDRFGWEEAKKFNTVRQYLQRLGVSARQIIDPQVWVTTALNEIDDPTRSYVITDVRFKNEVAALRILGGELWRISRPGVEAVNNHVSESELANEEVDRTFINGSSIEALEQSVGIYLRGLV